MHVCGAATAAVRALRYDVRWKCSVVGAASDVDGEMSDGASNGPRRRANSGAAGSDAGGGGSWDPRRRVARGRTPSLASGGRGGDESDAGALSAAPSEDIHLAVVGDEHVGAPAARGGGGGRRGVVPPAQPRATARVCSRARLRAVAAAAAAAAASAHSGAAAAAAAAAGASANATGAAVESSTSGQQLAPRPGPPVLACVNRYDRMIDVAQWNQPCGVCARTVARCVVVFCSAVFVLDVSVLGVLAWPRVARVLESVAGLVFVFTTCSACFLLLRVRCQRTLRACGCLSINTHESHQKLNSHHMHFLVHESS
jgi:hypothetical protein